MSNICHQTRNFDEVRMKRKHAPDLSIHKVRNFMTADLGAHACTKSMNFTFDNSLGFI